MAINFTKIFQDSWNFVRNTRQITITFVLLFFLNQALIQLLSHLVIPEKALAQNPEQLAEVLSINSPYSNFSLVVIINQLISFLLSLWCLASIHQVSHGVYVPSTSLRLALKRFGGALFINLLLITPLVLGLTDIAFSVLTAKHDPSVFSLIAMAFGLYIFIRCCLASVYYLFTPLTISQALRDAWKSGHQRVSMLLIYCALIYFMLPLISSQIAGLSSHIIFDLLSALIMAFLSVFSLVFTYRFYTLFMHKV